MISFDVYMECHIVMAVEGFGWIINRLHINRVTKVRSNIMHCCLFEVI